MQKSQSVWALVLEGGFLGQDGILAKTMQWQWLPLGIAKMLVDAHLWEKRGEKPLHIITQNEYDAHDCHGGMESGCEACVSWFSQQKDRSN